jgi:hypothetical protein
VTARPGTDGMPWGAVIMILDALESAGFRKGDDEHVGRAIGLMAQLGRLYAGQVDQITDDPPPVRTDGRPAGRAGLALVPPDSGTPMTAGGWLSGPMP